GLAADRRPRGVARPGRSPARPAEPLRGDRRARRIREARGAHPSCGGHEPRGRRGGSEARGEHARAERASLRRGDLCGHRPQVSAIRADHLSKNYKLRRERTRTLTETVLRQYAPAEQVQALRDVSFAVEPGASFGVVGANGTGKSTLLKLLAGPAEPPRGPLKANGP